MVYKSLRIDNFRGISQLELQDFGKINLLTGLNDAGKTTVLEALFLHASGPLAAANTLRTLRPGRRQIDLAVNTAIQDPWEDLFHNRDRRVPIVLHSTEQGGGAYTVSLEADAKGEGKVDLQPASGSAVNLQQAIRVTVAGTGRAKEPETTYTQTLTASVPTVPTAGAIALPSVDLRTRPQPQGPHVSAFIVHHSVLGDLAEGYSALRLKGGSFDVLGALRDVDPRIQSLEVISENGRPSLWVTVDGELLPVNILGDGAVTLLSYVISAAQARDGMLLIDEFGAGIHHSALPSVWRTLYRAAQRFNLQIFATTHSNEVIEAAAQVIKDHADDLVLYRLIRPDEDGQMAPSRYSRRLVGAALNIETELR